MSLDPRPNPLNPLKPVDFQILLALTDEERHGYGILLDLVAETDGALSLDPGNLYRSLRRLLAVGLIEKSGRRPAGTARRRYYRLSEAGRAAVAAEARRLARLVDGERVRRLLAETPG